MSINRYQEPLQGLKTFSREKDAHLRFLLSTLTLPQENHQG